MAAGLLLTIRFILQIMTSAEFSQAYRISAILIIAVVFTCFSTFTGSVYMASKKSMRSLVTALSGAILNVILNFTLIPIWGLYGAAISILVSYMVIFVIRAVDTKKIVRMNLKTPKIIVNSVILLAMTVVVIGVQDTFAYYINLGALFLLSLVINFGSALGVVRIIREKRGQE